MINVYKENDKNLENVAIGVWEFRNTRYWRIIE